MTTEPTIPCLSLWQPWATLMEIGAKTNETRSWATKYRGPIAIHAAKTWNQTLHATATQGPFFSEIKKAMGGLAACSPRERLPFGAILCVVTLTDCVQITPDNTPVGNEFDFGDYTPGRFMWQTTLVRRFPKPIPWKGGQRLFRVPLSVLSVNTKEVPSG